MSISALSKELERGGLKLHRLMVTGYLRAMRDMGILRERSVPPSKVYGLQTQAEKDLYDMVGEKCRSMPLDDHARAKAACYILQKVLKRPVFLTEIRRCGFHNVSAKQAEEDDVESARRLMKKAGMAIAKNEPAYMVEEDLSEELLQVVSDIIVEKFSVKRLVRESKQVTLGLGRE